MGFLNDIFALKKEVTKKSSDAPLVPPPRVQKKPVSEWQEAYIVTFKLAGKKATEKVQFNHALVGRPNGAGILQKLNGKKLGLGCLLVPAEGLEEMEKFMGGLSVPMQKQKILLVE